MIKSELVAKLTEQTNLTKTDAENVVSTVFKEITKVYSKVAVPFYICTHQ